MLRETDRDWKKIEERFTDNPLTPAVYFTDVVNKKIITID